MQHLNKTLSKSTLLVSSLTLFSRLLGFMRDMLIARYFGVSEATDNFFVAFRFPNFLRRLFAEGNFSQAFVPILSEHKQQNDNATLQQVINKISGHLALLLAVLTFIGVIIAPLLIWLYAAGFDTKNEQQTAQLLQIMLPYGFFITLVAFFGSILNAYSKFVIPAITPALLNFSMIGATLWLSPYFSQPIFALAVGVLLGGIIQLAFQIIPLWQLGFLPRFELDFDDLDVKRVMKNLLPTLFATSATQINLLINTFAASFLMAGSVSWLYYADRLLEFPLGIFGTGLTTVMLPKLAQSFAKKETQLFSETIDWGLRGVILVGTPATIGLIFLAEPILSVLFQSDEFSSRDVHASAQSLQGYALGLVGFLAIKVLNPVFTTQQIHSKAVHYAWVALGANLFFMLGLIQFFEHTGIAAATGLAAILNALLLLIFLLKNKLYSPAQGWFIFGLKMICANAVMIGVLLQFTPSVNTSLFELGQEISASVISYGVVFWLISLLEKSTKTKSKR